MTEEFLAYALDLCGDCVYRTALCRMQNRADAEDVFQETFLSLCRQTQAMSWSPEHLKAWLLRVAINKCNDLGRIWKRRGFVPLDSIPELSAAEEREKLEIWEAVSHLPQKQRLVFHLYYGEGYRSREIARILHISDSAVRVNLNRARETLRKEWKANV